MKRTLISAIALAAFTSAAAAMSGAQLTDMAQDKLDAFGIEASATTLTRNQIAAVNFVDETQSEPIVRAQLEAVVDDSADMSMVDEQLASEAQMKLDRYGVNADVATLTRPQMVEVFFVDDSQNEDMVTAQLNAAVSSDEMTMPNPQIVAEAQDKLDRFNINADASTLTRSQIAEINFIDDNQSEVVVEQMLRSAVEG